MMGSKHSKLARDAVLAAISRRRLTLREAEVKRVLDQVDPAEHENVMELARAEAEFLKKKRLDEVELQYRRHVWESETRKEPETAVVREPALPVATEHEKYDFDGTWNSTRKTVDGTETKQEWDVDPQAAEKWGVVGHDWDDSFTAQNTAASQEKTDESESERLEFGNAKESMPWDEDCSSDEEKVPDDSISSPEVLVDNHQSPSESDILQWAALVSQTEDPTQNRVERLAEYDDDEAFFSWHDLAPSRPSNHEDERKGRRATREPDASNISSFLPTPPPSPTFTSSPRPPPPPPDKIELPSEQAWKTIGHVLADVHFEERMSAWAAVAKALDHRLRSRGHDYCVHRTNRSPEVRDAEMAGLLRRRDQDSSRVFNVVTPNNSNKNREEAEAATGSAHPRDVAPTCLCRGPRCEDDDGSSLESDEDALRCPFNRRQRHHHSTALRGCAFSVAGRELWRCSRLRQSVTTCELIAEEEAGGEDSAMKRS